MFTERACESLRKGLRKPLLRSDLVFVGSGPWIVGDVWGVAWGESVIGTSSWRLLILRFKDAWVSAECISCSRPLEDSGSGAQASSTRLCRSDRADNIPIQEVAGSRTGESTRQGSHSGCVGTKGGEAKPSGRRSYMYTANQVAIGADACLSRSRLRKPYSNPRMKSAPAIPTPGRRGAPPFPAAALPRRAMANGTATRPSHTRPPAAQPGVRRKAESTVSGKPSLVAVLSGTALHGMALAGPVPPRAHARPLRSSYRPSVIGRRLGPMQWP